MGRTVTGEATKAIAIEPLVQASGVEFLECCDPYDNVAFEAALRRADTHMRAPQGGVAVIIARHGCLMEREVAKKQTRYTMAITTECIGCRLCVDAFECPALSMDTATNMAVLDPDRCIGCGACIHVCPVHAIPGVIQGEQS